MSQKEVIHLVGDFRPDVLQRWTQWAELTNRIIRVTTFEELDGLHGKTNPLIILDEHGLNDAHLPGDIPCSTTLP